MNEVYRENDRGLLLYNSLIQEHIVIQRNIVHRALADICGSSKDIGDAHIDSVVSLFALQVGRLVELPYGIRAVKVYDGVELRRKNDESAGRMALGGKPGTAGDKRMVPGDKCISPVQKGGAPAGGSAEDRRMEPFELTDEMLSRIERGETVTAAFPSGKICFRMVLMAQAIDKPPKKKYTKWFDYDIIKCRLVVRTRASGDYFILDESGHRRKLKEYFITEKVPSYERDGVMLLAQQSRIAWIIGYRMSEDVKVTDATDRILEVTYMPQHAADSGSARQ
jgi:tRNA(Ile)-lysidine synthase